ncbi:hypothetical protein AaE_012243, partial [Aphanomyces astaci]
MFPAFSSRYTATIQRVMDLHNPLTRTYATAKERLRRAEADGTSGGNLQIDLKAVGGAQARTHNLPTVAQLAVIMEGDGSEPTEGRHVVLQSLNSNRFTTIRETNPLIDALQFPLLFPMGGSGWEYTMTKTDGKSLSLRAFFNYYRAFFNYWLQERDGDDFSSMMHRSSMLFKMYTTVSFVRVETNRLRYISQNGDKLRFDLYTSVKEAAERRSGLHNVGIKSIVPSSFTGGKRYMKKCYLNAMAIVR